MLWNNTIWQNNSWEKLNEATLSDYRIAWFNASDRCVQRSWRMSLMNEKEIG
jgi:hypothetical protein